jgi:hypothetical protein
MATLSVQEFENFIDLHRKLKEAIAESKEQRKAAKAELTQSLAKDSAAAPLSVDAAIAIYKDWKFKHATLEAKITDASELDEVVKARIDELKKTEAKALNTAIQRQLAELNELKTSLEKPRKSAPATTP